MSVSVSLGEMWSYVSSVGDVGDVTLDHLVTFLRAEQINSGFANKFRATGTKIWAYFSPTDTPRDPGGRRGAELSCPQTWNRCVEAVSVDTLSKHRMARSIQGCCASVAQAVL